MPNHVHFLIYPYQKDYNISKIMQSIKGKTSTRYRSFLLKENSELFEKMCIQIGKKKVFRFWQAGGGFDRNLWNAKAIHASIIYIEANPVRAGLVESPDDWKWSSAAFHTGCIQTDSLVGNLLELLDITSQRWKELLCEQDNQDMVETIKKHTRTGRPVGEDSFVKELEVITGRKLRVQQGGRPRKTSKLSPVFSKEKLPM